MSGALQDFQDSTKKLKDRFTDDYSASAEVEVVLKQGTAIDTFMKANPGVTKGRSEWDHWPPRSRASLASMPRPSRFRRAPLSGA